MGTGFRRRAGKIIEKFSRCTHFFTAFEDPPPYLIRTLNRSLIPRVIRKRRWCSMKKLLMLAVAICLASSTAALAQDMGKSCNTGKSKMAAAAPLKTLNGTVKAEGDKITFVS